MSKAVCDADVRWGRPDRELPDPSVGVILYDDDGARSILLAMEAPDGFWMTAKLNRAEAVKVWQSLGDAIQQIPE